MNKTVCIVVTFNRFSLLKRLLLALKSQSYKDFDIWVIDNGSNDGTQEWMTEQTEFQSFFLKNNGPGASFAYAFEQALAKGYHNFWIMDDDGLPDNSCLENLIRSKAFATRDNIVGSMVIDQDDHNKLSFLVPQIDSYIPFLDYHYKLSNSVDYLKGYSDPMGYPWGMFFNSVLLPREAIEKIGFPRTDFFIWGDEVEYAYRARKNGFMTYIIAESKFYHPNPYQSKVPRWKEMFEIRNYLIVDRLYRKWFLLKAALRFFRILKGGKIYLLRSFYHGLTGNTSYNYLREQMVK